MKEIVLGLLGLGNIGGGVWDLIREFGDETANRTGVKLRVKRALVLDKKIHGGKEVPDEVLTTDKDDVLTTPPGFSEAKPFFGNRYEDSKLSLPAMSCEILTTEL